MLQVVTLQHPDHLAAKTPINYTNIVTNNTTQRSVVSLNKIGKPGPDGGWARHCWGGSEVCACVPEACRVSDCAA